MLIFVELKNLQRINEDLYFKFEDLLDLEKNLIQNFQSIFIQVSQN